MDFKTVDKQYRPIPFWSWNEKLEVPETMEQIEKMDAQGIGGFFMHARGGLQTEYMGEAWFENVAACLKKCEENGMHPWAYDENGWPSGFGGGIVNGMGVAYQQKYLRYEEQQTHDNTIVIKDGIHFYYEVNPFYVDLLDEKVTAYFIENIHQRYYDRFQNKIDGFFTDEPQISRFHIPWSFVIPEEYEKAYGESILDKLIELFKPIGDYKNTRIKFWKLVTELFSKNYMKKIYDWCDERNLKFSGHLLAEDDFYNQLAPSGACMPHYEYFHIPGIDWLGRYCKSSMILIPYQVSSAAQQLGKKQVISESFALCGHNIGHDELKWIFEYQMVRGINLLCQHLEGYSNRGLRKRDYPPAMYIQQPWWNSYKVFNDAMSRIGMLLANGEDTADVLVLHPQTTAWTMYDDTKACEQTIMQYTAEFITLLRHLEEKHIRFHLGDEILMERHGAVDGAAIVVGQKRYTKVIVPQDAILLDHTKTLLEAFANNGGILTSVDALSANDIIDIPQITYCHRRYPDFDLHYFVNSTEAEYSANIKQGNKVLDITTGELSDFDGTHRFRKYESLVVIDEHKSRAAATPPQEGVPICLDGSWDVVSASENAITLDYCDYYFNDILEERDGYILNVITRALERQEDLTIRMEYKVHANYLPPKLFLVSETPELFRFSINGKELVQKKCGYFRDKSFEKLDISGYLQLGENCITVETAFHQSEAVYENIRKGMLFESEKNKLTYDMEIEQIYLVGDFSVQTNGTYTKLDKKVTRYNGDFVIEQPRKTITLKNIEQQGFPFFAGEITVKKRFHGAQNVLDFSKCGINVVKARVNGQALPPLLWEPYCVQLTPYLKDGENELELTLINNLRNLLGPFHLKEGETYYCGPGSFHQEPCIWSLHDQGDHWDRNYCFAELSLTNRCSDEKEATAD